MKKLISVLAAGFIVLTGCSSTPAKSNTVENSTASKNQESKISVLTSFNAIDKIVKKIGADKVETKMLVTPGVEPHDFELTPKDVELLNKSNVLFINGLDMEHWAEGDKLTSNNKNLKIFDLSKDVDVIKAPELDPHIWLGVKELKTMGKNAYEGLVAVDANNKDYYKKNLDAFVKELTDLENEYNPKFKDYKGKGFVTGHEAFAYLCRNLGLEQKAVENVFNEGEPTPQKIKELVDYVNTNKISTVFLEENAAPKVSETIAKETKTKLVTIPTLETEGELIPSIKEIYDKVLESFK